MIRSFAILKEIDDDRRDGNALSSLESFPGCQICCCQQDRRRACFRMVGQEVPKEARPNYQEVCVKVLERTHKFGAKLPKSVKEALEIDRRTVTTFWRDAIEKEMKNVMPAFEFREDNVMPIGHKAIDCHMIFDVKMVGPVRTARFVAGG
jgi:hypothetical protein